jgi:hypothetical protein
MRASLSILQGLSGVILYTILVNFYRQTDRLFCCLLTVFATCIPRTIQNVWVIYANQELK